MPEQMKNLYNLEQAQAESEKIRGKASSFASADADALADKREILGREDVKEYIDQYKKWKKVC